MPFQIGDRVGDYEIVQALGAGGMGKVFKVRNLISDRIEAMKVLLPDLEGNPDLADRFLREIKVLGSLSHQNIAPLFTAQRHGNQLLMFMEYVEGFSIDQALAQGRPTIDQSIDWVTQMLAALACAHARNVVHRDIKPANLMVTPEGVVKLMDFGIAKMRADKRLTQTGLTVGSLYYMSPEQIKGEKELDPRSDIYSTGITLYEIVTGKRPFAAGSDFSIMAAHMQQNPTPPIEIDPSVPPLLNEIILMAIAKEPEKRFQSAEAFRTALLNVKAMAGKPAQQATWPMPQVVGAPPPPPPPPAKSHRGLYMAMGSLVTVGVLVILAIQLPKWREPAKASPEQTQTQSTPQVTPQSPPPATEPQATPPQQETAAQPTVQQPAQQAAPPITQPTTQQQAPQQTAEQQKRSTPKQQPAQTQTQASPPVQLPTQQAQSMPADPPAQPQAPPPQQARQPQTSPDASAQAKPALSSPAELESVRDLMMKIATRFNAAQSKAKRIEQQQQSKGLGMRSDVVSGLNRVSYLLDEAENTLKSGKATAAKGLVDKANLELGRVEDILGI